MHPSSETYCDLDTWRRSTGLLRGGVLRTAKAKATPSFGFPTEFLDSEAVECVDDDKDYSHDLSTVS